MWQLAEVEAEVADFCLFASLRVDNVEVPVLLYSVKHSLVVEGQGEHRRHTIVCNRGARARNKIHHTKVVCRVLCVQKTSVHFSRYGVFAHVSSHE